MLLVAGEASGDLHGADLLRALRARVPALHVCGIGGEGPRTAGMETLVDAADVATVGVVEGAGICARSSASTAPSCVGCARIRRTSAS